MKDNRIKTKEELTSGDAFVFAPGRGDGSNPWPEDAVCITEDDFTAAGMHRLFRASLDAFAYYGITVVDKKQWERTLSLSKGYQKDTEELTSALDSFAERYLEKTGCFTIYGI